MTRRLFATAVAALSVGVATAAPVPKAPPPPTPKGGATVQLATAKVNGDLIQVTQSVSITQYIAVQEVVVQNGQNVTITKAIPQTQQVQQTYAMSLKGTKASTTDGKEIAEDDLAKKLGDGAAVVQVPAGFDPEWKKLFADDVIFLEPNAAVLPGGRLAPLPAPVPVAPPGALVPVPAVAPAIEKK